MKAGRIGISERLILQWLQFPNATILESRFNTDFGSRALELVIEDEEMPEVKNNNIETIVLSFTSYTDGMGHSVAIREPLNK